MQTKKKPRPAIDEALSEYMGFEVGRFRVDVIIIYRIFFKKKGVLITKYLQFCNLYFCIFIFFVRLHFSEIRATIMVFFIQQRGL